jgi:hypothetical protein
MSPSGRHPAVEAFVRETLGCGCPQEVFEHIEDSRPGDLRRIAVGGRLLVYLITPPTGVVAVDRLAEYLSRGQRERDELGFNRFRLVIAAGEGTANPATLVLAFERLRAGDERLHLHLVPADALPPD